MSSANLRTSIGTKTAFQPAAFVLAAALSVASAGCGSDSTVGGLTNPNPGSVVDRDKGAVRVDTPVPDLNAGNKEPAAEVGASSTSGTGSNAGTGAAGGQPGSKPEDRSATSQGPKANPPAKENSGDASGGSKPSGEIKDGTPKSPQ